MAGWFPMPALTPSYAFRGLSPHQQADLSGACPVRFACRPSPLKPAGRAHLPARHPRARPEDGGGHGQAVRRCQEGSEEGGAEWRWGSLWAFPQLSEQIMDCGQRNGDAKVPGHIVMTHEDVHSSVSFVPPNRRLRACANLERAPLVPVRLLDVRELPEFVGRGPNVQFPRVALQLDQARGV